MDKSDLKYSLGRVLIPTNDRGFVSDLADAYSRAGYEVTVGLDNFFLDVASFDVIHIQWPEEFSDWKVPDSKHFERIKTSLKRWAQNSKILITVHNLYPHGYEKNTVFRDLYSCFYSNASIISYFSESAKILVNQEYPETIKKPNIVHGLFNYDRLLSHPVDVRKARMSLGLDRSEFVVLVFGRLRSWDEVSLLRKAFSQCPIRKKRLLMAGRYFQDGPIWRQRVRKIIWTIWLKTHRAVIVNGYVPDDEVHRYLEACDVVVVPRIDDLTTGIVPLGMTFGKTVVAPGHESSFIDYLGGTNNPLYKSGNPESLSAALVKAFEADRDKIGSDNRKIAEQWSWDQIIKSISFSD